MQEGPEQLLRCDQCGIHIPETRIFMHRKSDKCHKVMERRTRGTTFRYLGRPLDHTDDNWMAVRRNIMRARSV